MSGIKTTPARLRALAAALVLSGWGSAAAAPGPAPAPAAPGVLATATGAPDEGNPRVRATLLADVAVASPSEPFRAAVHFEIDRGWHIYWRNPGQSGLPTRLDWAIESARVGPILWPAPSVFREADGELTTYGYADELLLANEVAFEPGVSGEQTLAVTADFLVCEVRCIPGKIALARAMRVAERSEPAEPETRALLGRWSERVPVPPTELGVAVQAVWSQSAIRPGDAFRGAVAVLSCVDDLGPKCRPHTRGTRDPLQAFVPDRVEELELEVTGGRPHPLDSNGFLITLRGHAEDKDPGADQRLGGVLALRAPDGRARFVEVDLRVPRAPPGTAVTEVASAWLEPAEPAGSVTGVGLLEAVLLALLGGLILNLMPCVLPVLAIKAFSIAELADKSRREVLQHGFAYAAGVLATMAALAATVIALRAAGVAVGWGFQFQEPLFIAVIGAVLLVFALNLFGVFEIFINATALDRVSASATGLRQSFFEGLLAVIVATPCSAPFLGTAVGFAFASSTPVILGIFLAVGFGLASPVALIALVPAWAKLVPRPGPWMLRLRQALGFALLGTVVWLLWVLGQSTGTEGMTGMLVFLVAIGFATWIYGAVQAGGRRALALALGLAVAGLAVTGLASFPLHPSAGAGGSAGAAESRAHARFEAAAVSAELGRGRPVFVYFTADWCLTCKVNERAVLTSSAVLAELERLDVAVFEADWTRRDDAIRAELARFGRAGVPMYLLYNPDAPGQPELLPELLTVDLFVAALRRAARAGA